jgi:ribonucleoside-diphosphate reductase alpha chain
MHAPHAEAPKASNGHSTLSQSLSGITYRAAFATSSDPYDGITVWTTRDIEIKDTKGSVVFHQASVEAPSTWSDNAVTIVASKYFRGQLGAPDRESSVRQVILRVTEQIRHWAALGGYFDSDESLGAYLNDLRYLLVRQMASFNSPVWFNLGWSTRRQATSACYINEVCDSMDSILDLVKVEGEWRESVVTALTS